MHAKMITIIKCVMINSETNNNNEGTVLWEALLIYFYICIFHDKNRTRASEIVGRFS